MATAILHEILSKAIEDEDIAKRYEKEVKNSWEIAKEYRKKINPKKDKLPETDITEIKRKVTNKVKVELLIRISKGYGNIDLNSVECRVEKALKELKVK